MTKNLFCILMEFANAGTMSTEIKRYPARRLPEAGARHYMIEIISAVSFLHDSNIAHCCLHISNILLNYNKDGVTKRCLISDFGSGRKIMLRLVYRWPVTALHLVQLHSALRCNTCAPTRRCLPAKAGILPEVHLQGSS